MFGAIRVLVSINTSYEYKYVRGTVEAAIQFCNVKGHAVVLNVCEDLAVLGLVLFVVAV